MSTNETSPPKRKTAKELEEILSGRENWSRLEAEVKGKLEDLLKSLLPVVIRHSANANLTSDCQEALVRTTFALRQLKGWALKMLDATGKPTEGMLEGTISSLGSYEECVSTVAHSDTEERRELFAGKYCTLLIRPPVFNQKTPRNFDRALSEVVAALRKGEIFGSAMKEYGYLARHNAVRWGVCVPSTCVNSDVQNLAQLVTSFFGMSADVPRCEEAQKSGPKQSHKIVFGVFGVTVFFCLLGTILTQLLPVNKTTKTKLKGLVMARRIMECFCIRTNLSVMLNHNNPVQGSMGCLHGIRCLTMIWIIYGHTYFYNRNTHTYRSLINGYDGIVNNIYFTPMINFTFAVETFFFISGLLVVYSKWTDLKVNNGRMNYFVFLTRRYLRLTPMLATTICLAIVLPLFGQGPLWHETVVVEAENCEARWWMNILYFNNLVPYYNTCMVATWYLATNMQFYVISILFVVPLYRYPRLGVILVLVIASLGVFATGAITYLYDLAPAMMFLPNTELLDDVVVKIYHKPYAHISGFCVGVLLGFLLKKQQKHRVKLWVQAVLWILAFTLSVTLLFGIFEWNRGSLPTVTLSSLYAATHRTAWTLPLAWLIYACVTGQAGLLNRLLSWPGFIPLSNLSYATYLIHPLAIIYNIGSRKERVYYDHYNMAYLFCGNFLLTVAVSVLCYLVVEAPFANLEKLIFRRRKSGDGTDNFKVVRRCRSESKLEEAPREPDIISATI